MFNTEALKRKYCNGDTEVVTFRFPTKLKEKIQAYAEKNGRTATDVVITVMDQFVQALEQENTTGKKGGK